MINFEKPQVSGLLDDRELAFRQSPPGDSRQPTLSLESAVQLAREIALAGRYAGFLTLPADEQATLAFDVPDHKAGR